MHALVEAGADVIELGVPFSDPMADGPVIQRASERALANTGRAARTCWRWWRNSARPTATTPVVLMGYANPIEHMGYETFAEGRPKAAGGRRADGGHSAGRIASACRTCSRPHGLDPIFLLSPTTPEARMEQVAKLAGGYVYYVSLKGVTGAANLDAEEVARKIAIMRKHSSLPVGVGFGIRDAATAEAVARIADAVVVGSRIVQEIEDSPESEWSSACSTWWKSCAGASMQRQ